MIARTGRFRWRRQREYVPEWKGAGAAFGARFPALAHLAGGYMGQDWDYDYGSPEAAIAAYLGDSSDANKAAVVAAIDALFAELPDERARSHVLFDLGWNYSPRSGEQDALLLRARSLTQSVLDGAPVPEWSEPANDFVASPGVLLLRFPHLKTVGRTYFSRGSAYARPAEALEAYAMEAERTERALTMTALLNVARDVPTVVEQRALLQAVGWDSIPEGAELTEFLARAVSMLLAADTLLGE